MELQLSNTYVYVYLKAFKYLFKGGKYDKNNHKLDMFYAFFFTMNLLDFENRCQNKNEVSSVIHLYIFGLTTVDLVPKIHISNILFCNLDINKKICFSHILLDFYVTRQIINKLVLKI